MAATYRSADITLCVHVVCEAEEELILIERGLVHRLILIEAKVT
jgi:hypothetical protein